MTFSDYINESKGPDVYRRDGKNIEKMMFAHAAMQLTQGKIAKLTDKKQVDEFDKYKAQIEKLLKQGKVIAGRVQTFYSTDKSKIEGKAFDNTSKEIIRKIF